MPLPTPNLDDRTFQQLKEQALARIAISSPEWNDLSEGDPGITLLEVFAYLTETLIYRLNRVPDKAYITFLNLLGIRLLPPEASSVQLVFTSTRPASQPVTIPRGTRVTVARAGGGSEAPVFVVAADVVLPQGQASAQATAYHCELVEGELLGKGTGTPGQTFTLARSPVVGAFDSVLDLVIAVEATAQELANREPARKFMDKSFRIWREVQNFAQIGNDPFVYTADRSSGLISFSPSLRSRGDSGSLTEVPTSLAAVPSSGREIRAWYAIGGGPQGNVAANSLTVLKSALPGFSVTNPSAAAGGRSAESLANALTRGPLEVHSLQRAVTARDYELLAQRSGAVSRARAFTKVALWTYAVPGTVQVVLVPFVETSTVPDRVSLPQLEALQTDEVRARIQRALDDKRPLATLCEVTWARYKEVAVKCKLVAHPEEDVGELHARVLTRLNQLISPLPSAVTPGWRFGQALRSSQIYDAALAEPGILYIDQAQFFVDDVPSSNIQCIAFDFYQPATWYAGRDSTLYRTQDDGDGWVAAENFAGERVTGVQPHPLQAGLVALHAENTADPVGSHIYLSFDCGDNWKKVTSTAFQIIDMAWVTREEGTFLLLATAVGLFELSSQEGSSLDQVFVRSGDEKIGYYAITSAHLRTGVTVAVASRGMGGVYVSDEAGKSNTFRSVGKAGEDVRVLCVQTTGGQSFLWAGMAATAAGDVGKGCSSWTILGGGQNPPEDWQEFSDHWIGGSCVEIGFRGDRVFAATYDAGVVWLEKRATGQKWQQPDINCGLPQSSREHPFARVDALAAHPVRSVLFAGGANGIFRSADDGQHYTNVSCQTFADKVTLPPNWLFCSGIHEVELVAADESLSY